MVNLLGILLPSHMRLKRLPRPELTRFKPLQRPTIQFLLVASLTTTLFDQSLLSQLLTSHNRKPTILPQSCNNLLHPHQGSNQIITSLTPYRNTSPHHLTHTTMWQIRAKTAGRPLHLRRHLRPAPCVRRVSRLFYAAMLAID